jgi:hypothetical protein
MDTIARFKELLSKGKNTDDGIKGDCFENVLRQYIQPKSKRSFDKVTKSNTTYGDLRIKTEWKKNTGVEIKSCCGELYKIPINTIDDIDDTDESIAINLEKILTKGDLIIYAFEIDENYPIEKQGFVFTHEEFLQMILSYDGKGQMLRLKRSTDGNFLVVSFQSYFSSTRQKASKKLREHIENHCIEKPTVEEYFNN